MRVVAKNLAEARRRLPALVKMHLGQGSWPSPDVRKLDASKYLVELNVTTPNIVLDPESDERSIAFVRYVSVGAAEISRSGGDFEILLPTRDEMQENLEREREGIVTRAEAAFLESAQEKLARSPILQNALNPIREVIALLREQGRVEKRLLTVQKRYLPLLRGLRHIDEDDGWIFPGPMLLKMERSPIENVMGDIIRQGYNTLAGPLRIRHLTSYVRAANAYFWPSHQVGRPLKFALGDFSQSMRRVYRGYNPGPIKLKSHVIDLTAIGVFKKVGDRREADEGIWRAFENHAPALA